MDSTSRQTNLFVKIAHSLHILATYIALLKCVSQCIEMAIFMHGRHSSIYILALVK